MSGKSERKRHSCEEVLTRMYPNHAQAQDGELWICECGLAYEHVCDEASGCRWDLLPAVRARRPHGR